MRAPLRLLYNPKADHRNLLARLKNGSPDTFSHVIRLALQMPGPRMVLLGHPFPSNLIALYSDIPLPSTGSLHRELRWTTEVVLHFAEQLNEFLRASAHIERYLFTIDYNAARAAIAALTKSLGWSLWTIQSDLLLADLEGGIASNRGRLSEILDRSSELLKLVAYFYSLRTDSSLSAASYDARLHTTSLQQRQIHRSIETCYLICDYGLSFTACLLTEKQC